MALTAIVLSLSLVSCGDDIEGTDHGGTTTPKGLVAVDLGLPSGTKWANMNVGATKPEGCGDYFAWGETTGYESGKMVFNWKTYTLCDGAYDSQTKYNKVDNKTELDPEDDAASAKWGKRWCTPTRSQMEELMNECTRDWTTQNGVGGFCFTGPSGKSIFLPAAGFRDEDAAKGIASVGTYWTRTLSEDYSDLAIYLYFNSAYMTTYTHSRYFGHSIRPVLSAE